MIADKIYNLKSFKRQYDAILVLSVCKNIPNLVWSENEADLLSKIDWNNILGIASILCQSSNDVHIDASLRIAQTCIQTEECSEIQKNAAAYVLECLTNHPAIKMATRRKLLDPNYTRSFSIGQKLETNKIKFESTFIVNDSKLYLNKFQQDVYRNYKLNDAISISAPTSAGKSFILCKIILEEITTSRANIIYIVPTRALISQVEKDVRDIISENNLGDYVNVSSVPPQSSEVDNTKSNIFVFTQERLHWFINNNNLRIPQINLLIIDEAHKIEDGNRGILLQQKLEELLSINGNMKIYFSSPFTSNPEILLENTPAELKKGVINTKFIAVNQNLIYAMQERRKPKSWLLSLVTSSNSYEIGKILLDDTPSTETKTITYISNKITSSSESSIVYANSAAEAEIISSLLYDKVICNGISTKLRNLIDLVKKTIHPQYYLAKSLEKGIAFHYGNMPLLIREEIEQLFSEGEIRYLVCTSTLLEGVNLPAKSIVIRKPLRGKGNPLNSNDFWNLAGRAGRWGKEFSGNIICIAPDTWKIPPDPRKSKQIIKRAIDVVELEGDKLISYIDNYDIPQKDKTLEAAFSYYYIKHIIDKHDIPQSSFYNTLSPILKNSAMAITVPDYIIKKNPGISPIAQQRLLNYFHSRERDDEDYIPVDPSDQDAYEEYTELIGRIGKTLANYPPVLNNSRALLLINWMKGYPMSTIIQKSIRSYSNKKSTKKLAVIIREVMDNIETFVRYEFAKDSSCYIDILRYYLESKGRSDLLDEIPQLTLWLEFGVSEATHLSLLSLGLSRSTVIELSQRYITNSNMTPEECVDWLSKQDFDMLDMSPIMLSDMKKALN